MTGKTTTATAFSDLADAVFLGDVEKARRLLDGGVDPDFATGKPSP